MPVARYGPPADPNNYSDDEPTAYAANYGDYGGDYGQPPGQPPSRGALVPKPAAAEQPASAADSADPAARGLATARSAFAHDAVLVLGPDGDPAAPGGAITVALCGHWDHDPPCPLAPHHTDAGIGADDTVRLRVLFAVEPEREGEIRALIDRALASGQQAGPDGRVTRWTLRSSTAGGVRPEEEAHAARLVAH